LTQVVSTLELNGTKSGTSTKQISQAFYISEYTVKDHLSNIFEKVRVRGRRTLVKQLYLNTIFLWFF
jgi:DNA-binding CsgD family transcriptional regulator